MRQTDRTLQIPLAPDVWMIAVIPHPMTEEQWYQMLRVLDVMRPGIVENIGHEEADESGSKEATHVLRGRDHESDPGTDSGAD